MNDFFDNIDDIEIISSPIESEHTKPEHIFTIYAFVGENFNEDEIKRIVYSSISKLTFELTYDIEVSDDVSDKTGMFFNTNAVQPTVKVTVTVRGSFNNVPEVLSFIDAICYGKYVHVINGNIPFPTMYIEYQSPVSSEFQKDVKFKITMKTKFIVNLEITPNIYLSQDNSDFDKNDYIIQAYTNSLIKICHLSIDENNANESELRHCLGLFDKDSLYYSQKYHAFCIGVNDIITYDSDLNIENISSVCFSEGDTLSQEKYFSLIEWFTRAKRIKNLDRILNEDIRDVMGRGVTKTIGCKIYEPNDKDYVAVWDGFPNVHHPENSQYAFFIKLFYENREQLKRKFMFPTASVPKIVFYNQETDYIKIVLRLGSIYDIKTKNTIIVTMGLCGNFNNVINHIKILYDL